MNFSDKEALSVNQVTSSAEEEKDEITSERLIASATPAEPVDDEMDSGSFNSVLSTPFEDVKVTNDEGEEEQGEDDKQMLMAGLSQKESVIPTPPQSPIQSDMDAAVSVSANTDQFVETSSSKLRYF
jgi:hypothetical protein